MASRREQSPSLLSSSSKVLTLIVVLACVDVTALENAARQRNTAARRPANASLSFIWLPLLLAPQHGAYRTIETLSSWQILIYASLLIEKGKRPPRT